MATTRDMLSVPKLGADNYWAWATLVQSFLTIKGCWDAVSDSSDQAKSAQALAYIRLLVSEFYLPTLEACKTAQEAWDLLEASFKSKSLARRLQLKRELNSLQLEGAEDLTQYVARAKTIRGQLVAAGYSVSDDEVVLCVLAGLPAPYDAAVTMLEGSDKALTVDEVLAKLLPVEQRVVQADERGDAKALYAGGRGGRRISGGGGFGGGGGAAGGRGSCQQEGSKKVCWHCGESGHIKARCPKLQGRQNPMMSAIAL